MPHDSVAINGPGASMRASDLGVPDYHDLINALFGGAPPVPGTVSYDVTWEGSERLKIRNADSGLGAELWTGAATIEWSGRSGGFEFVSDAAATSISLVAEFGHERNGVFFP